MSRDRIASALGTCLVTDSVRQSSPDTIAPTGMSKSFAAPRTIRRIAARRVFKAPSGKLVVGTLGVPQAVPGLDWGCALQITGLNTRR